MQKIYCKTVPTHPIHSYACQNLGNGKTKHSKCVLWTYLHFQPVAIEKHCGNAAQEELQVPLIWLMWHFFKYIYIYIFRFTIVQSVFPRGISFNYSESDVALALAEFSGYVPFLCLEFCWCGTRGTCPYLQYGRDSAPSISRALQAFINPLIIIIFISFCWFLQLRDLCGCHGCFHSV